MVFFLLLLLLLEKVLVLCGNSLSDLNVCLHASYGMWVAQKSEVLRDQQSHNRYHNVKFMKHPSPSLTSMLNRFTFQRITICFTLMALLQIENIVTARFVTLVNDGFNDDILQAGANQSVISGWSNSGAFVFHPTANLLPDLPDSPNVLVLQSQARVTQLVLADVLAGETITFSISMVCFLKHNMI